MTFDIIFWLFLVLTMATLAAWQGLLVYARYKQRPVIVTIDRAQFDWSLILPSVTICSEEFDTNEIESIIGNDANYLDYLRDLAFKNYTNYEEYEIYANGTKKEYLRPEEYMDILDRIVFKLNSSQSRLYVALPLGQNRLISRIFTELGPCIVVNPNASIYYTPEYFNSTNFYRGFEALRYTANNKSSFVFKKPKETKGDSYLYFHAPNELIDILDRKETLPNRFYLKTKFETKFVSTSNEVLPLNIEQKKCRSPIDSSARKLAHSPIYSHNLCKFECRIKIALKYCKCTPYYYRRLDNEPICNLTGLYCLSKHKDKLIYLHDTVAECANCPQNCDVAIYQAHEDERTGQFAQSIYQTDFVFPAKIYVRNLIFSKTLLAVQIGGIFALFLGCSLLSMVEIAYAALLSPFWRYIFTNKH